MRALVTGATGFIGSHLAEELLKKGYRVDCLARKTSDARWIDGLNVAVRQGDCLDEESLVEAVKDADIVFHAAGLTKAPREKDFFEVNVRGTENILRAVLKCNPGLRRFVYLSSLAAVGPSADGGAVNEDTPPKPVSGYGKSKLEGERVVVGHADRVPVTVIRPPAVYGPRDKDFYVLYRLLKRGIFPYWGRCRYSLLYVDDLVRGLIQAAESPEAAGGVFFFSEKVVYSNDEIAEAIAEALGTRPIRLKIPKAIVPLLGRLSSGIIRDRARELSHPSWICDASKASRVLGFSPKTTMNEGMKWTANWYRIHQWL